MSILRSVQQVLVGSECDYDSGTGLLERSQTHLRTCIPCSQLLHPFLASYPHALYPCRTMEGRKRPLGRNNLGRSIESSCGDPPFPVVTHQSNVGLWHRHAMSNAVWVVNAPLLLPYITTAALHALISQDFQARILDREFTWRKMLSLSEEQHFIAFQSFCWRQFTACSWLQNTPKNKTTPGSSAAGENSHRLQSAALVRMLWAQRAGRGSAPAPLLLLLIANMGNTSYGARFPAAVVDVLSFQCRSLLWL